ncbi:MAG: HigA family addiction module antidote protein [Nitrospirae bacterium]|nr:HigA family addiction module antidote protein [Nitrospirota bacterium]
MKRDFKPVHPGVILREIIEDLSISQARLSRDIGVSPMRISHIINGTRPVTGDIALRLGRYFGQSPQFWMNLQSSFDMQAAQEKIGKTLRKIQPCVVV